MPLSVKIGDLIEIKLSSGVAYAQYTHKHAMFAALLRVFNTTYPARPENLSNIVGDEVRFSTFFPLGAAVNRGIVHVVGHYPVAPELMKFPVFRDGLEDSATGKVAIWWLWNGVNEKRIGKLTEAQKKLPIRSLWNDTMLIESIESGWRPETDPWT